MSAAGERKNRVTVYVAINKFIERRATPAFFFCFIERVRGIGCARDSREFSGKDGWYCGRVAVCGFCWNRWRIGCVHWVSMRFFFWGYRCGWDELLNCLVEGSINADKIILCIAWTLWKLIWMVYELTLSVINYFTVQSSCTVDFIDTQAIVN